MNVLNDLRDVEAFDTDETSPGRRLKDRSLTVASFSAGDFVNRFRMDKQTFENLLSDLSGLSNFRRKRWALSREEKLLMTLRFYATGSLQTVIGDFGGVSKSTVSRAIHEVTDVICALRSEWIKWFEDSISAKARFYNIASFPGVIGCLDCTHVRLQRPSVANADDFINRKGYYSINTQVICDSQLRIVDIVCRWPGSVHDSRVFHNSSVKTQFEDGLHDGLLLGDQGYPCKKYLLTPMAQPRSPAECSYNRSHTRTRISIERCFGILKRRFLCLHTGLRYSPVFCCNIILACAILHNYIIQHGGVLVDSEVSDSQANEQDSLISEDHSDNRGLFFRNSFILQHFSQ